MKLDVVSCKVTEPTDDIKCGLTVPKTVRLTSIIFSSVFYSVVQEQVIF